MFLFAILALILILLIVFTIVVISVGGSVMIIIFGDVIVCGVIIGFIIHKIIRNKKNE